MSTITSLFKILFQKTGQKRLVFFLTSDIIFICLAFFLAFFLRFEGEIPSQYFPAMKYVSLLALIFCLPIFYFQKLYSFSWSYVSTNELISLFKATSLGFLFLFTALFVLKDQPVFSGFPRSTIFISYFLVFLFCSGFRLAKRLYLQFFLPKTKRQKERTLIVGAGDAGEQILRSILSSRTNQFQPIGFVDDSPIKQGVLIHGLKVFGKIENIPEIAKEKKIEGIIIALPSAGSSAIKRAVEKGREAGLKKIKIVPPPAEIIDGRVSIRDLKEIQIEDLLGREPVSLDWKTIEKFIQNKKVLVTGAAGSIGSELCRQIAKFEPSSLLALDQDETGIFNLSNEQKRKFPELNFSSLIADIQDKIRIEQIFNKFRPDIIFHAAAYKHVPLMEENPEEAIKNNIFGTLTVARAAIKYGVEKFVLISTDKAVNPSSVMGATKRVGEMLCQTLNQKNGTKFISVRFGNVLDSRGSVIPIFKEQIKRGGPVEVTHPEMKRYFMSVSEAVLLVMEAGAIGQGGEVFVLDMGEMIKIKDLAKELIRLEGLEPDKDIPIVYTEPRPGEKFFEEILTAEEGTVATQYKKIFRAKLAEVDEEKLNNALEKLKKAVNNADKKKIIEILKDIVPSYRRPIISRLR